MINEMIMTRGCGKLQAPKRTRKNHVQQRKHGMAGSPIGHAGLVPSTKLRSKLSRAGHGACIQLAGYSIWSGEHHALDS